VDAATVWVTPFTVTLTGVEGVSVEAATLIVTGALAAVRVEAAMRPEAIAFARLFTAPFRVA